MRSRPHATSIRLASPAAFALAVVAVMATHTLARDHLWRFEWRWAAYQYHFGVLLAGPVACGLAAWVGVRVARGRWLLRPAGDAALPLAPLALGALTTVVAYVATAAAPLVLVLTSGTDDQPGIDAARTFAPAIAAMVAYVAVGGAAGVRWPSRLTPPLAAIGGFALTMAGWVGGLERLVRLGGAGTSMSELRPDATVQAVQTVAYGALATAAFVGCGLRLAGPTRRRRGALALALVVCAGSVAWLTATDHPLFDHPRTAEVCVRDAHGRRYCAPAAYRSRLDAIARHYEPLVERVGGIGAAVPARIRPIAVTTDVIDGTPSPTVDIAILFPMLGVSRCVMSLPPDGDAAGLTLWLAFVAGDRSQTDGARSNPTAPPELTGGDPATADRWAAAALARLRRRCDTLR